METDPSFALISCGMDTIQTGQTDSPTDRLSIPNTNLEHQTHDVRQEKDLVVAFESALEQNEKLFNLVQKQKEIIRELGHRLKTLKRKLSGKLFKENKEGWIFLKSASLTYTVTFCTSGSLGTKNYISCEL